MRNIIMNMRRGKAAQIDRYAYDEQGKRLCITLSVMK